MSERLTPEQEREVRAHYGDEVQSLAEVSSGYAPLPSQVAIEFAEQYLGLPVKITQEDQLRGAIVEACVWLQQGAPGCALQVLENALLKL